MNEVDSPNVRENGGLARLTKGQIQCLQLVEDHMSSREIATKLAISPHTVDQRIRLALQSLGVERRSQAARIVVGTFGRYPPTKEATRREHLDLTTPNQSLRTISSARKTSPGAKLGRSETVTVRLDPKLNYLCELGARAQRRTKSSFIEWAIADSLGSVALPEVTAFDGSSEVMLKERASELWHVDEADRLVALAFIAPALLTHEEQLVWRVIRENGLIWRGGYNAQNEWSWRVAEDALIFERLRDYWEIFKGVAFGELSKDKLPSWVKQKPNPKPFDTDLDDDVPF